MIIVITGASHTGKTLLAQRLLEIYKYPYLSIDHLKMGLIRSVNTDLTTQDDERLTEYLWPIICQIIKTAIENEQNLIVEGCYVPSYWQDSFEKEYMDSTRLICMVMTDKYIDTHFDMILEHNSDIEHRLDDSDCTCEYLKSENKKYFLDFKGSADHMIVIDSDYEEEIKEALKDINDI